jgi:Protein of unknown function (DUF3102)
MLKKATKAKKTAAENTKLTDIPPEFDRRKSKLKTTKVAETDGILPQMCKVIDAATVVDISEIARRIRARTASAVLESGRDLQRVKDVLKHGEFEDWLRDEVQMEPRTAQNYMAAARWVDSLKAPENEMVSYLPPSGLYLLAKKKTPDSARRKVIASLKEGKTVTHDDIVEAVKGKKGASRPTKKPTKKPDPQASTADLCLDEFQGTIEKVRELDADTQRTIGEIMIDAARDLGDYVDEPEPNTEADSPRWQPALSIINSPTTRAELAKIIETHVPVPALGRLVELSWLWGDGFYSSPEWSAIRSRVETTEPSEPKSDARPIRSRLSAATEEPAMLAATSDEPVPSLPWNK